MNNIKRTVCYIHKLSARETVELRAFLSQLVSRRGTIVEPPNSREKVSQTEDEREMRGRE
jgi:hypothetical protein